MIPVEYLWFTLFFVFGIIGMARGLWNELGVSTLALLSLFVLKFSWEKIGDQLAPLLSVGPLSDAPADSRMALFYIVGILFVAYIAYEGVTLKFPIREMKGALKAVFGLVGGLLNGYLIIGTVWDAINAADYFGLTVPMGMGTASVSINSYVTEAHAAITQYLPITFVNEFVMLILGMILLLAIVLK